MNQRRVDLAVRTVERAMDARHRGDREAHATYMGIYAVFVREMRVTI